MADSKITALTALTAADPANDMIPIVDVSDTPPASGNTKRISINNILACSPSATLASATISGDLTVRTTGLVVNATGVGMGMTPAVSLDITSASAVIRATSSTGTNTSFAAFGNTGGAVRVGAENSAGGGLFTGSSAYSAVLGTTGAYSAHIGTNGNVRLTVDISGNVGVGVTPAGTGGCLQLKSGITFPATQVASSDANTLDDYEEGTFTATLNSGTFTSQVFRYTKIGNMVTVFFDFTVGTGGGDRVTNLPFTSGGTVAAGIYTNSQDYVAGTTSPVAVIGGSSTTMFFRTVGDNVPFSTMTLTAAANLSGSISYFV
jgi:hypothetical protein